MKRFIFIFSICLSIAMFNDLTSFNKSETMVDESSFNDVFKTNREIFLNAFSSNKGIPQEQVSNNIPVPSVRIISFERRHQSSSSVNSITRIRHSNIKYFARCSFLGPHLLQSPASAMVLMLRHLII